MVIDDRSVPDDREVADTMNLLDLLHDPSHVREYSARGMEGGVVAGRPALEEVREYRRHLPLTTLTWNAEPEDAIEIERVVATSLSRTLQGSTCPWRRPMGSCSRGPVLYNAPGHQMIL